MCGIALIYHSGGRTPEFSRIKRMTDSLFHRGPDDQGTEVRGAVALGHTRLSIVDVTGGKQPMITADDRYTIVFNGEIYNYKELRQELEDNGVRLNSHSDTEVILQLYSRDGASCVSKLRGMFSFAVHDSNTDSLFVVRDRLGIKPLVYHWDGETLLAGSEIKALFASGLVEPEFNPASIQNYFTYQFAITPNTIFKNILELPAGHHLTITQGGVPKIEQYWDLEFPREGEYESNDEDYWLSKFQNTLEETAECHTIGEVPIGAYLSGGIDSATTTWLLTRFYDKPVESFSVHFPDSELDESSAYRAIAKHLGSNNTELVMDNNEAEGYLAELVDAMYHLEQPQRMGMDIPFGMLAKTVHDQNYRVVYSGEGADEILGGYDFYRQDYMRLWGNDIQNPAHRELLYFSQFSQNFSMSQMKMLYGLHEKENQQRVQKRFGCYPVWYDFWHITDDVIPGLFKKDFENGALADEQMDILAEEMKEHLVGRHRINQSLYIETKTRLPGWILWRSDRMSMAHSVELRVPFMDHKLVELAARVPPDMKLNGMNEKYILKKIATSHLPEHPGQYKKQGFYTPIREWFFMPEYNDGLDKYLSADVIAEAGIFEVSRVQEMRDRIMQASAPTNMEEYYQLMKLEWMMMLVLTIQILHAQFIRKQASCFMPEK